MRILIAESAMMRPEEDTAGVSLDHPVFILCNGRSGSTLLRFVLDSHPEFACPPETNLPGLCAQLATVWSLIEGAPLAANRGDEPPEIPDAAIAGVRQTMDRMVGSYLERRRKSRYCDKSLGTARCAELLLRIYPEAKFVCLYRHPMDVIASGMEACPWGLNGYGFDPYIAAMPGNMVMALANFWADNTSQILSVEDRFPQQCHRVRYEDLVQEPDTVASELFRFLDVPPVAGISASCFSAQHERFGPADYKIWSTSRISHDSVGRGWSIPAAMIGAPVLGPMNELAGQLGYVTVDSSWGTSEPPADLRTDDQGNSVAHETDTGDDGHEEAPGSGALDDRPRHATVSAGKKSSRMLYAALEAAIGGLDTTFLHGEHLMKESFVAVVLSRDRAVPAEYVLVDLGERAVAQADRRAQDESDWDVVGYADAWDNVMDGNLNLYVALRTCKLRYCENAESTPVEADNRARMLVRLLGLSRR
jgi:protein-tyrosine sulfotransferase